MIARELITLLGFKYDKSQLGQYKQGIDQAKSAADGLARGLSTAAFAAKAFVTGVALNAVKNLGANMIGLAGDLETTTVAFETLLGSAEKANKVIADGRKLGAQTPYESKDILNGAQVLANFNVQAEDLIPTMSMLGDIASGSREKLASLSLVFGQVMSTGRLQGGDLLQLINAGFNPLQVISEQTGKSMAQLKKEMEKGAISADMVKQAFISATSAGGRFYQMSQRQSKTLKGMWSTLQDDIGMIGTEVGTELVPIAKEFLGEISKFIGQNREGIKKFLIDGFKTLAKWIGYGIVYIEAFVEKAGGIQGIADKIKNFASAAWKVVKPVLLIAGAIFAINKGAQLFMRLQRGFAIFTKILPLLKTMSPILLAIALAAGVIYKNWDKIAPILEKMRPAFEKIMGAVGTIFTALEPLIDTLGKLLGGVLDSLGPVFINAISALQPLLTALADIIAKAVKIVFGDPNDKHAAPGLLTPIIGSDEQKAKDLTAFQSNRKVNDTLRFGKTQDYSQFDVESAVLKQLDDMTRQTIDRGVFEFPFNAGYTKEIGLSDLFKKLNPQQRIWAEAFLKERGEAVPKYADGTSYVPKTGPAILHKGEMVVPAAMAAMARSGGGVSKSLSVTSSISVSVPAGTASDQADFVRRAAQQAVQVEWEKILANTEAALGGTN